MRHLIDCSALLFDGSSALAVSRLFVDAQRFWCVRGDEPDAVQLLHDALDEIGTCGAHVVLSLSYESLAAFGLPQSDKISATPWLQALAFTAPRTLNRAQALDWLAAQSDAQIHLAPATPLVNEAQFSEHIATIRALIAAGDTYQVNYTFPLRGELLAHGDAPLAALYHQLVADLKIPYGAFLNLPHNSLLSCSPELLVEMTPTALTCRPMKGTSAVSSIDVENTRRAAELAADPKNRAENLMIVDLMRNDLSRLPQTRRVTVPKLFEVKRYGAVLQMTSTVKAHLSAQPSLSELLQAIFQCGSITGAPKHRTIDIINQLEPHPRGAYCGAIGLIEPVDAQLMNATFSVPIRTIETTAQPTIDAQNIQHWPLTLSVGAGITYDSNAADEWQESLLKAQFLTRHTQPLALIEAMRVESGQIALLPQHMARMQKSAAALGWSINSFDFSHDIAAALKTAPPCVGLRLGLQRDGTRSATVRLLENLPASVAFAIHPTRVDSINPFLRHKTTARALYNAAVFEAKKIGLFDYVFMNERDEITEGARSNIFVLQGGQWFTPPLDCGVLAGVQRAVLIEQLKAQESILRLDDLHNAEKIMLSNALYGALPANYSKSSSR